MLAALSWMSNISQSLLQFRCHTKFLLASTRQCQTISDSRFLCLLILLCATFTCASLALGPKLCSTPIKTHCRFSSQHETQSKHKGGAPRGDAHQEGTSWIDTPQKCLFILKTAPARVSGRMKGRLLAR